MSNSNLTAEQKSDAIQNIVKSLELGNDVYEKICEILLAEMKLGLGRETNENAVVKMFPTYVRSLPNGKEEGNYLALDLGGTNFRVLLVTLKGQKVDIKSKIYLISKQLMVGHGELLFDHIAECIAKFMQENGLNGLKLHLGFTFSFPCRQEGLAVGRLVTWTKGFKCEGVEGEDVVRLLHEAIRRRKDLDVDCVAVLNDTVGTLMSCAHSDHDTQIGLILGTGTNACYVEKLEEVGLWDGDYSEPKQVVINTEWGAFGDNGVLDFIFTEFDRDVDQNSINPGKQLYEKMISGMYMGEITRLVLAKCTEEGLLFNGYGSDELYTIQRFYTKYVSEIESDNAPLLNNNEPLSPNLSDHDDSFPNTRQVLDEMGIPPEHISTDDCRNVHLICSKVSTRAAYLASAGVATLLNKINKPRVTVGVDGSLYRFHPHFHNLMMSKITDLISPDSQFQLMLSEDGSGKGASLVAAVAYRVMYQC